MAEQTIPADFTPLMLAAFSGSTRFERALKSIAPARAKAIFCPAATFGAPHTTVVVSPPPRATVGSVSRSALGCGSTFNTSPTITLSGSQPAPVSVMPSTSVPAMVSRWARSAAGISTGTYFFNQDNGTSTA